LLLESVNASRFDLVLGVLPGSQTNDGELLINGQADLALVNPFGTGKQLSLHWENPKPRSPKLNVNFSFPYLFSSPLGMDYQFDLFKNDTLYIDITHQLGVSWLYGGGNSLTGPLETVDADDDDLRVD
jgi:outer membrane protein assembly factor BamA